jgi:hypothetical protein
VTYRAEVWRYDDPSHKDHGTWSFQILHRRWDEHFQLPEGSDERRQGNILDAPGDQIAYMSMQEAVTAARLAIALLEGERLGFAA